jgi:hypothetical protein
VSTRESARLVYHLTMSPTLPKLRPFALQLCTLAFFSCTWLGAQSQTIRTVKPPIVSGFDTTLEKLPPSFPGNSIVAIFQAVAAQKDLQKSEFETSTQYQDRITLRSRSKLAGNLSLNGSVAFVVPFDAWEPKKTCQYYDADKQALTVLLQFGSANPQMPSEHDPVSIQLREERGPRSPAGMAQNGFGAKFPISRQSITRYYLDTTVPEWFNRATSEDVEHADCSGSATPSITLQMDQATALRARGSVSELLIGHLAVPFLGHVEDGLAEATTSYPVRANIHIRSIYMEIDEIWFFNERTGEVYRKITPDAR